MNLANIVANSLFSKQLHLNRKDEKLKWEKSIRSYVIPRSAHFAYFLKLIENVPGAIMEAGVRGGESLATLAALSKVITPGRKFIAADSFQGFPADAEAGGVKMPGKPTKSVVEATTYVKEAFKLAGFSEKNIQDELSFEIGYFENSLKNFNGGPIALLHIDVDLGKSYTECLNALYKHVSTGGVILFDEYDAPRDLAKWPEAKPAIDAFLADKKFRLIRAGFVDKIGVQKLD